MGCKHAIIVMCNNPAEPDNGLSEGGSIINTASFVAIMRAATPQLACPVLQILPTGILFLPNDPDTAWKGGVLAMSRELAMVYAKEDIQVNTLCPLVPSHTLWVLNGQ